MKMSLVITRLKFPHASLREPGSPWYCDRVHPLLKLMCPTENNFQNQAAPNSAGTGQPSKTCESYSFSGPVFRQFREANALERNRRSLRSTGCSPSGGGIGIRERSHVSYGPVGYCSWMFPRIRRRTLRCLPSFDEKMTTQPDSLSAIQRPLLTQLAWLALAFGLIGLAWGGWRAGVCAMVGCGGAIAYYWLLGIQIRQHMALQRLPGILRIIFALVMRQAVSFLAISFCYFYLRPVWWVALITLTIARHWIFVFAWRRNKPALRWVRSLG
jgi:hypothetical protein